MAQLVRCDFCLKTVDRLAAKIYFTPVVPGKPAIMANYTHHADSCSECAQQLMRKMNRRKARKDFPTNKLNSST